MHIAFCIAYFIVFCVSPCKLRMYCATPESIIIPALEELFTMLPRRTPSLCFLPPLGALHWTAPEFFIMPPSSSWSPLLHCLWGVLHHATWLFLDSFTLLWQKSPSPCHQALLRVLHCTTPEVSFSALPGSLCPSQCCSGGSFSTPHPPEESFITLSSCSWDSFSTPPQKSLSLCHLALLGVLHRTLLEVSFTTLL